MFVRDFCWSDGRSLEKNKSKYLHTFFIFLRSPQVQCPSSADFPHLFQAVFRSSTPDGGNSLNQSRHLATLTSESPCYRWQSRSFLHKRILFWPSAKWQRFRRIREFVFLAERPCWPRQRKIYKEGKKMFLFTFFVAVPTVHTDADIL